MKTLTINGANFKVNAHLLWNKESLVTVKAGLNGKQLGEVTEQQIHVVIEGKTYENRFTEIVNCAAKTARISIQFRCNKTGVKFGDSHKKVIEHLIALEGIKLS